MTKLACDHRGLLAAHSVSLAQLLGWLCSVDLQVQRVCTPHAFCYECIDAAGGAATLVCYLTAA